ncbi:response regulator [Sulfitobacter albidus]|uniref:histidine kinase n=1 Tax=Sulfitobacter albidus TaxID=2829501 RepID=A0A975JFV7_9RHOB|nr:ATP-binding protein [Sulfitobacter albidus]QUJ77767.1 response regulator [Sulfitobacter albidus]
MPDQSLLAARGRFPPLRLLAVAGVGVAVIALAQIAPVETSVPGSILGGALMAFAALLAILSGRARPAPAAAQVLDHDGTPCLIAEADGIISYANPAALAAFGMPDNRTVSQALGDRIANPGPVLFRLQSRADSVGFAREEIVTGSGSLSINVHQTGENFVWRIDVNAAPAAGQLPSDNRILPMIMVGRSGAILSMNHAARQFVGARSKTIEMVFTDQVIVPGTVMQVATTTGDKAALIAQTDAGAGRRAIYLLPPPAVQGETASADGWPVFQNMPIPMIKISPQGQVMGFNARASALIGVALVNDANIADLMEGLGRAISDWLDDTLAGRLAQKSEFLRLTRRDRETFVQVTLNRIEEDGAPALVAVLHDATELKTLEAQFVQSQKMQAIGQLAGGVAHDFNNLLTAISGHCDLLLLRHDPGDANYDDLIQINQNANRAASLVGQLLAFSRKQTLRPETLDMRDTLADLTHLLNRLVGEKVTLTLRHDPVLRPIRADKRQLEQVLMNLVVNARDAMPSGGEVRIVTEAVTLDSPLTRDRVTVPSGDYITIRVEDDGVGIPGDRLQKVFEPFVTSKRTGEGTGLGLSTAYGIVKQTGGYIFVDSEVDVGTSFILYFPVYAQPLHDAAQPKAMEPAKADGTPHDGGVILLVEDEAPVRAFASRALRLRGYTVLEAENAEAALNTLEDRQLKIDCFVTDVVMPGMDGPSWVREALKDRPDVRVVFVSGYAEDSLGEAQKKIPNSVFLPKPFSLNDLTETVNKQLH